MPGFLKALPMEACTDFEKYSANQLLKIYSCMCICLYIHYCILYIYNFTPYFLKLFFAVSNSIFVFHFLLKYVSMYLRIILWRKSGIILNVVFYVFQYLTRDVSWQYLQAGATLNIDVLASKYWFVIFQEILFWLLYSVKILLVLWEKRRFSKELCALALSSLSALGQHRVTSAAITNPLTRCHREQLNSISSHSQHYSPFVWVHLFFLSRAEIETLSLYHAAGTKVSKSISCHSEPLLLQPKNTSTILY